MALAKECSEVINADVLEHPNRNDTVELPIHLAVVAKLKVQAFAVWRFRGSLRGVLVLLLGERNSCHLRSIGFGKEERETSPSAANVEDAGARLDK